MNAPRARLILNRVACPEQVNEVGGQAGTNRSALS